MTAKNKAPSSKGKKSKSEKPKQLRGKEQLNYLDRIRGRYNDDKPSDT